VLAALKDVDWTLVTGFLLGIAASGIVAVIYDRATKPLIEIVLDDAPIALGQHPGLPPHAFYHLRVRNRPALWPLAGRRPAWSSRATIEVFAADRSRTIPDPIQARWPSQPEPLAPAVAGDQSVSLVDFARLMNARKVDIHCHEEQTISLAIKFDGQPDCYIFRACLKNSF
jgi:hypothetical protein